MLPVDSPSGPPTSATQHSAPQSDAPAHRLAAPTLGIFVGAATAFAISTVGYWQGSISAWATIPINAVVVFVMFTVVHDAVHHSVSTIGWVNGLIGRLAWLLVVPIISFPSFSFIHIEHHRHTNDDASDPDGWATHSPAWQLPLRWPLAEVFYGNFLIRRLPDRPAAEVGETLLLLAFSSIGLVVAIGTGNFWTLAMVFLIPQRIGIVVLAWWFDWLPHHGLADTPRSDRYRATRVRVGMEWLVTPLMLSQNYHLVHHLQPSVPFYRYLATWRRHEEAYLDHGAAIATVFGQQLAPDEFREWKKLNGKLGRVVPTRTPTGSNARHPVLHRIPVATVEPLSADSTLVSFAVPDALRDEFRFSAGQHVTIQTGLGGANVRRSYSICTPATSDRVCIAVKRIPGGAFSGFVADRLKIGDVLEVMTPTGSFGPRPDPRAAKHYVGLVAGSGIAPVLSILETTLQVEPESRFTLIYGNRTKASMMFRVRLDRLASRYAERLAVVHVLSGDPLHTPELCGRIDPDKLHRWLASTLRPETVDEWLLCGPIAMSTAARSTLIAHGVDERHIHLELFTGYPKARRSRHDHAPALVTFTLAGRDTSCELAAGDSILDAALQVRSSAPYACMGGACGSCRAKLLSGTVEMAQNFALTRAELDAGYILTCQAHPTSPTVTVNYDV